MTAGREPELAGQTVVLIGGSAGIGLETARRPSSKSLSSSATVAPPTQRRATFSDTGSMTYIEGHARIGYFFMKGAFWAFSVSIESQTNCPARRVRVGSVKT